MKDTFNLNGVSTFTDSMLRNHCGIQAYCYDCYTRDYTDDIEWYRKWIGRGKNVLEVGIGTGRIAKAIYLNAKSYTGIDISAEMIATLEKRCQSINIVKSCMTEFTTDLRFDRIFFPFKGIQYCTSHLQAEAAICNMKRYLNKNGRILFDVFPLSNDYYIRWNGRTHSEEFTGPDGLSWQKNDYMEILLEDRRLLRRVEFFRAGQIMGCNDESLISWSATALTQVCEKLGFSVTNILTGCTSQPYAGDGDYFLEAKIRC